MGATSHRPRAGLDVRTGYIFRQWSLQKPVGQGGNDRVSAGNDSNNPWALPYNSIPVIAIKSATHIQRATTTCFCHLSSLTNTVSSSRLWLFISPSYLIECNPSRGFCKRLAWATCADRVRLTVRLSRFGPSSSASVRAYSTAPPSASGALAMNATTYNGKWGPICI